MKVEYKFFVILSAFFLIVGTVYGVTTEWDEPVGPVGLYLCMGLCLMIGGFLWWTGRKLDTRPEDRLDGEISDVDGDYGFFSPHSYWPLAVAASAAVVFLGLAIGWWLVFIGAPLVALAATGWVFEYFHGDHAI
ncbi:cytochrome c oxidase subunit 4 [Segeticoccus rhizosphaerae]|jgi:hypothetical protein|uniref:cytochrome c oxidase subunit 4 n=1 Tax=Segeticoccus rhizosphaerae TaxID=1104777 RepID=UPI0010C06DC9|nr:cytochrome c oxidase subunit 4 [Ornithinicoccus soli]